MSAPASAPFDSPPLVTGTDPDDPNYKWHALSWRQIESWVEERAAREHELKGSGSGRHVHCAAESESGSASNSPNVNVNASPVDPVEVVVVALEDVGLALDLACIIYEYAEVTRTRTTHSDPGTHMEGQNEQSTSRVHGQ